MGIHSREYFRNDRPGWGGYGGASDLWAIKYLLIANILVFLLQVFTAVELPDGRRASAATQWLSLNLSDLLRFQVWRLVTYGFCHDTGNIWHIAFNMFILWMFGRAVEPIYGSREFLGFYLVSIVIAGIGHVIFQAAAGSPAGVVGASGGVMAVVFLTAMHYPRMTVLLMFIIPIELRWLAVMYAVLDVFGVFRGATGIAHVAHLGGAAFGVLYFKFDLRVHRFLDRLHWPRFRGGFGRRRKVRLYDPPPEQRESVEQRVDALLQKISEQGEASLTDEEREFLKSASRRYRKR